jgi:predicted RNA binding protein YcfA (HicA-like mRNA interferase family)
MPMSGKEMLKLFNKHGWVKTRQRGSHVRVCKSIQGHICYETIPLHRELKKGIESALLHRLEEVG